MSEYDYGNARLRAMKSRLLTRQRLEALAEAGNLQSLTTTLLSAPYRPAIEAALATHTGGDYLDEALRRDLVETMVKVKGFYHGDALEHITFLLQAYDVHNVKTILRGLSRNAPPVEIMTALLPIGELNDALLAEIARAQSPRAAIDVLASLRLPIAKPLLELRAAAGWRLPPEREMLEMDLALERWYYQQAQARFPEDDEASRLLIAAIHLDADLSNLLTLLRLVADPAEKKLLSQRLGFGGIAPLLVGPGRLPLAMLERLAMLEGMNQLLSALKDTPYAAPLQEGFGEYSRTGRLSEFEKSLRRYRLRWMAQWIAKDPLGLGVFLGYQALKVNEIAAIRWIARGIRLGLAPDSIRRELEAAP